MNQLDWWKNHETPFPQEKTHPKLSVQLTYYRQKCDWNKNTQAN